MSLNVSNHPKLRGDARHVTSGATIPNAMPKDPLCRVWELAVPAPYGGA